MKGTLVMLRKEIKERHETFIEGKETTLETEVEGMQLKHRGNHWDHIEEYL